MTPPQGSVFQLLYCSTAARLLGPEDLDQLLAQSRERNARENVSGLLVYHGGGFVQVLEGPEPNVRAIFASIVQDPRHHSIATIVQQTVPEREFAAWHMAFRRIQSREDLPPGFSDFLSPDWSGQPFSAHPGLCHDLLRAYKESLY